MKERLIEFWRSEAIDEKLIEAFKKTPREMFILDGYGEQAYGDYPLPILAGQTISQPTTVMIMINALELKKTDKVLEVGAGSGWCAAIMSRLCKKVVTTEFLPELAEFAGKNIKKCRIKNVEIVHWDGSQGYEKEAPYDKIIVTAACPNLPEPLVEQLDDNGIIVAPIGPSFGQKMIKGVKKKGGLEAISLGDFVFVPLRGKYGYR